MRITALVLLIAIGIFVASCSDVTSPDIAAKNQTELDTNGKKVGVLPDGRELRMLAINPGNDISGTHYVYIVGDVTSTNQPKGKARQVVITIDGKRASIEDLKKLENEK